MLLARHHVHRDRRAALDFFRDDILRTQELIGRDLSAWLRA